MNQWGQNGSAHFFLYSFSGSGCETSLTSWAVFPLAIPLKFPLSIQKVGMHAGSSWPCAGVQVAVKHTLDKMCSETAFLAWPETTKVFTPLPGLLRDTCSYLQPWVCASPLPCRWEQERNSCPSAQNIQEGALQGGFHGDCGCSWLSSEQKSRKSRRQQCYKER